MRASCVPTLFETTPALLRVLGAFAPGTQETRRAGPSEASMPRDACNRFRSLSDAELVSSFWSRVERGEPDKCWPWIPKKAQQWYGQITHHGVVIPVTHIACALDGRRVPNGMHVDHLCRNPPCVNPRHLEIVAPAENILRGIGPSATNTRKTHCLNGHEFTPENTLPIPVHSKRGRRCRECNKIRLRSIRAARRLAGGWAPYRRKLTDEQVQVIRTSGRTGSSLADAYGVSEALISKIKSRKTVTY